MLGKKETFGELMRKKRMEKQITLRKFAELIGVSPTYISQIERNEANPPAEDKVKEMAKILGENEDEMLAMADKLASDLPNIIQKHPKEVAAFLRTAKNFDRGEWESLTRKIGGQSKNEKGKDK